jgi:hypothetical protein
LLVHVDSESSEVMYDGNNSEQEICEWLKTKLGLQI